MDRGRRNRMPWLVTAAIASYSVGLIMGFVAWLPMYVWNVPGANEAFMATAAIVGFALFSTAAIRKLQGKW